MGSGWHSASGSSTRLGLGSRSRSGSRSGKPSQWSREPPTTSGMPPYEAGACTPACDWVTGAGALCGTMPPPPEHAESARTIRSAGIATLRCTKMLLDDGQPRGRHLHVPSPSRPKRFVRKGDVKNRFKRRSESNSSEAEDVATGRESPVKPGFFVDRGALRIAAGCSWLQRF